MLIYLPEYMFIHVYTIQPWIIFPSVRKSPHTADIFNSFLFHRFYFAYISVSMFCFPHFRLLLQHSAIFFDNKFSMYSILQFLSNFFKSWILKNSMYLTIFVTFHFPKIQSQYWLEATNPNGNPNSTTNLCTYGQVAYTTKYDHSFNCLGILLAFYSVL